MMNKINTWCFTVLLLAGSFAMGQNKTDDKNSKKESDRALIQFSGMVVEHDSLRPIPYTAILISNTNRGTISDFYGYFSFVAQVKDTIEFRAVGFKPQKFVIPDTLTTNRYSLIQVLTVDTIFLIETTIYPWPTREQFKQAFLNLNLPDDATANAQNNLNKETMQLQLQNMGNDASMSYKAVQQQQYSRLYYAGQAPPNNLLNPVAWSKFIQAWRNGDFRNKEEDKKKKKN